MWSRRSFPLPRLCWAQNKKEKSFLHFLTEFVRVVAGFGTASLVMGAPSPKPGEQQPKERSENSLRQCRYLSPADCCNERIFCSPGNRGFSSLQGGISKQLLLTSNLWLKYVHIYRSSCDKSSLAVSVTPDREPREQPSPRAEGQRKPALVPRPPLVPLGRWTMCAVRWLLSPW